MLPSRKYHWLPIAVLSIGVFLILSWMYVAVPHMKNNYGDLTYYEAYVGKSADVESIGDELPQPTPIYVMYVQHVSEAAAGNLSVFSTFVIYDAITNEKTWESNSTNFVNKNTGKFTDPPDTYFRFPPDTQKQNYLAYIYPSGDPQPFVFEEETSVNDLPVYRFSCALTADLSESYPEFSPHSVFSDYSCSAWIEPSTGDEVYYEEKWTDYTIENGVRVPVSVGDTHTAEFAKDVLVDKTHEKIRLFYIYEKIIPLLLSLFVASVFVAMVVYQRQKQKIAELRVKKEKEDKLQTIGLLSSRLAHDIRNPLSVIKGTMEILSRGKNTDAESQQIARINNAISRITNQIDNVLDFVRTKPLVLEDADIASIINRSIASTKIPESTLVHLDLPPIRIRCDSRQLEIAFTNLIRNAIEALDGVGTINISAVEMDDFVHVAVEDSGSGVPPELMDKIFDPLFTTKQTGTGLGLVSCKNIVEQHGGRMTISRDPSTFTVILPKNAK